MAVITKTQLENASRDADDLGKIVNGAADLPNPDGDPGTVTTREGLTVKTVAKAVGEVIAVAEQQFSESYITGGVQAANTAAIQAAAAKVDAQTAAAQAAAAALGLPLYGILNASTAAGGSNVLPKGITTGTVGGTAVTGATPGTYSLTASGGDFTGVIANLVVDSATSARIVILDSGRTAVAAPTAPTWAKPSGANLPSGTTLTANIGDKITAGGGQYYLTPDTSGVVLLYWQNTGTGVPVAVLDSNGQQVATIRADALGILDPIEYEDCGYPWGVADVNFYVIMGKSIFDTGTTAITATDLNWAGQAITALDPDEYEDSGYISGICDIDFYIIDGVLRNPPAASSVVPNADTLYDLAEITDGSAKTQTVAVSRATGVTLQISPAGSNNTPVAIRTDGYALYKSDRANGSPGGRYARLLTGAPGVVAGPEMPVIPLRQVSGIGDSLTYLGGSDGTNSAWWNYLATLLGSSWTTQGYGISGQTADQIAARWGALPFYVTLTGNTLPASGSVVVTAITQNPISGQIHYKIHGRLGATGPYATLSRDGDEGTTSNYVLTQDAGGVDAAVPAGTQFIPDSALWGTASTFTPYKKDGVYVVWVGRNGFNLTDNNIDRIKRILATQNALSRRFVVVLPPPQVGEENGTTGRAMLDYTKAAYKAAFPNNWLDPLEIWLQNGNGSTQDNTDIANGLTPSSLRQDQVHPNPTGRSLAAQAVYNFFQAKGWL